MSAKPKLLIVDDDQDLADYIRLRMSQHGYDCFVAYGGVQAVQMYTDHRPQAVIMDMVMPGVDGLVAVRKIRTLSGSKTDPKILMLTVKNSTEDVVQSVGYGANDFATKPIDDLALVSKLEKLIKG